MGVGAWAWVMEEAMSHCVADAAQSRGTAGLVTPDMLNSQPSVFAC